MLLITAAEEAAARSRQVHVNGRDYVISEYVGAAPKRGHYVAGNETNDNGMPQGFLVHQPPNAITPAHFHEPNQFQVFVGGRGRMGAQPAAPLTVQYANGHTPYGPIVAGEEGVQYFTLRQRWDPGAKYLPASKEMLEKGRQRTRLKGNIGVETEEGRKARSAPVTETIFPLEADGLGAWIERLPPQAVPSLSKLSEGGGLYLIVASGTLLTDGRSLGRLSTVYISPDEAVPALAAGADGLDLLVLQFPRIGEELTGGSIRRS